MIQILAAKIGKNHKQNKNWYRIAILNQYYTNIHKHWEYILYKYKLQIQPHSRSTFNLSFIHGKILHSHQNEIS